MRTLALVLVLACSAEAHAQVEGSRIEDRVGLALFSGAVTFAAVWVVATPWRGFWHEHETPGDWRAWVTALAMGAAAAVRTGLTAPDVREALFAQAFALGTACAAELFALMVRTMATLAQDCDEYCQKFSLALPLFVGLTASFIIGQVLDEELGPVTMTAPLIEF